MVAEGVETSAQLEALRELGCDQYQGYHFSPALPPAQFEALIRSRLPAEDLEQTSSKLRVLRAG